MRATVSNDFGFKGMHHDDMKAAHKRLIKIHHPDKGGDTATCQLLNAEFAYWYARAATDYVRESKVADETSKGNSTKAERHAQYYNESFAEMLEKKIQEIYATNIDLIDGIEVDLVGVFIWIGGIKWDMKAEQNIVKSLGFQGSHKKHNDGSYAGYFWKWTPFIKKFGSNDNIDNIKEKYGATNKNRGKYGMTVSR